ncbi:MAG: hypothetical protein R3B40_30755 [Polyangiales bacterium]|nr:hypothetical protein [Myxococcales bacterium]MCB9661113.1 hypothetical protein [Sandaracinaceae bacterium]
MNTLSRTLSVFALVAALALPACGGPTVYALVGTPRSIGTDGTVEVDAHENGNYMVEIELRHLPPPARLGDGLTTYVVWFIRDGVAPTLAGALDYDDAERTGTMVATTPYSQFRVRVTAEENRDVTSPSDVVVAEQLVEE